VEAACARRGAGRGMAAPEFVTAPACLVVPAPGGGEGSWAGAPSAVALRGGVLLAYRLRAPRPVRGYELRLAWSRDGRRFEDLWSLHKDALHSASMERACLIAMPDGVRLYLSFVDPADGRWRIDVLEAERPERLDVRSRRAALTAAIAGVESVKGPRIFRHAVCW